MEGRYHLDEVIVICPGLAFSWQPYVFQWPGNPIKNASGVLRIRAVAEPLSEAIDSPSIVLHHSILQPSVPTHLVLEQPTTTVPSLAHVRLRQTWGGAAGAIRCTGFPRRIVVVVAPLRTLISYVPTKLGSANFSRGIWIETWETVTGK